MSKEAALTQVEANANEEWKDAAWEALLDVAERQRHLTTDNVWYRLERYYPEVSTHEPRAMGAIMQRGARAGVIRATGEYIPSTRPECNSRPVMVWEVL